MEYKLPLKSASSAFAKTFTVYIVDSNDELIAEIYADTIEEAKTKRNLIVTAVNVMPEMKVFLRGVQAGGLMTRRTIERRASELLERLEAVNVD